MINGVVMYKYADMIRNELRYYIFRTDSAQTYELGATLGNGRKGFTTHLFSNSKFKIGSVSQFGSSNSQPSLTYEVFI